METEFNEIDEKNIWNLVYQQIRQESCNYEYTCKDARKQENKNLNRYRDVNPYDHTRVRLRRGDKDYINASLVEVPQASRAYILTQGPLPSTLGHFWLMTWENKSKAILMLNRVVEKHTIKCHQYWPLGSANGGEDDIVLNDVGLKVIYIDEKEVHNYTIRNLRLIDLESGEERDILQFHYTTWPDFGVPESPSAFLNFLMAVRKSGALSEDVGPAIVHCSAGIGRSGTFCLVDSCLVLIEATGNADSVNVQEMLLEMRKYRMGLIQTADQLRFSYLAIIEGAKSILAKQKAHSQVPLTISEKLQEPAKQTDENGVRNNNVDKLNSSDPEDVSVNRKDNSLTDSSLDNEEIESDYGESTPPPLPPRIGRPTESSSGLASPDTLKTLGEALTGVCRRAYDGSANRNGDTSGPADKLLDGADRERELELRKRRRRERTEHTTQLVQRIRQKQRDSEMAPSRRRLLFKKLSLGVVLLMSTGIIVYRYYLKE